MLSVPSRSPWRLLLVAITATMATAVVPVGAGAQEKPVPDPPVGDGTLPAGVSTTESLPVQPAGLSEAARARTFDRSQAALATGGGSQRFIVQTATPFDPNRPASTSTQANAAKQAVAATVAASGGRVDRVFSVLPAMTVTTDGRGLDALAADPNVRSVVPDGLNHATLAQSTVKIRSDLANNAGYTGSGQTVAVLDDGFDVTHPFLNGAIVSEACYSADADCNGNASATGSTTSDPGATSSHGTACGGDHGTHVAGIVGGQDGTSKGVAPGSSLLTVDVFDCDGAYDSSILAGLERAYALRGTYNIAAVNLSLGADLFTGACDNRNPSMTDAITLLRGAGIATLIASGNDYDSTHISYPACISTAIAVGATGDTTDVVQSFSNSSPRLALLAPGASIRSSVFGGGFATWDGTSMATPHVAGAWAVLRQRVPTASVASVLSVLKSTGVSVTDGRNGIARKRIDVYGAVNALTNGKPDNDNFAQATTMSGLRGKLAGDNRAATQQTSEPDLNGNLSHSVWWKWTAPRNGSMVISTTGSNFDTVLAVYRGSSVGSLTRIAFNDDTDTNTQSRVRFRASAGTTYRVAVDGWAASTGFVQLNWVERPLNDRMWDAFGLSGSSGHRYGYNMNATRQSGEPSHAGWASHSVWWKWQPRLGGVAVINTNGSGFDTVLAVYRGSNVTNLSRVVQDDDGGNSTRSRVAFETKPGAVYRIAVDGYGGHTGSIQLNWVHRPPNDAFAKAQGTGGTARGSRTGTNRFATRQTNEPSHAGSTSNSVWWRWKAPRSGAVTIGTHGSNFDTVLAVYRGTSLPYLSRVTQNDNSNGTLQSRVRFSATKGVVYRIAVDGAARRTGTIRMNWSM